MPLIEEVLLGGAVGALIQAIFIAKDKASFFKKTLEHLESTLQSVGPIMEQVIKSEEVHHDTEVCKRFIQQLEKARILVEMYSDIHMWKLLKKRKVKKLIQAMDASLRQFLSEDFQVEQLLYLTIIDKDVVVINNKMDRIIALLRESKDAETLEEHLCEEIVSSPEKNNESDHIDGKKGHPSFELHWRTKREKCLDVCFWRYSEE